MAYVHLHKQKFLGVVGAPGSGKDTIVDYACEHYDFIKIGFSDRIYLEMMDAFDIPEIVLSRRSTKEIPSADLYLGKCRDKVFVQRMLSLHPELNMDTHFSPRFGLQQWGTEYRRVDDPNYWLNHTSKSIKACKNDRIAIKDIRFENEDILIGEHGNTKKIKTLRDYLAAETANAHQAEEYWKICPVHVTIDNNSDLDDLYYSIDLVLPKFGHDKIIDLFAFQQTCG
jgi:ABC-type dipeptide/oligopeptide/nickel transport system ATPase component